jgi:hypothetical protein
VRRGDLVEAEHGDRLRPSWTPLGASASGSKSRTGASPPRKPARQTRPFARTLAPAPAAMLTAAWPSDDVPPRISTRSPSRSAVCTATTLLAGTVTSSA